MRASCSSISMYGYVSDRDASSRISASHRTWLRTLWAPSSTWTSPRYDVRPPSLEIDFDTIVDVVSGAAWTIFAPASWCWPGPANATDSTSPVALGPTMYTDGYFIVRRLPKFPSIHSTLDSASARARLVTRL